MVTIISIYGKKLRISLVCGKSMTQQHYKAECDINTIMDKYAVNGYLVDPLKIRTRKPQFGDFTDMPDFQTAQNVIVEGREAFEALPARVRKYFNNDPALYLSFISDSNNLDQALEMGLIDSDYAALMKKVLEPVPDPVSVPQEKTKPDLVSVPQEKTK